MRFENKIKKKWHGVNAFVRVTDYLLPCREVVEIRQADWTKLRDF